MRVFFSVSTSRSWNRRAAIASVDQSIAFQRRSQNLEFCHCTVGLPHLCWGRWQSVPAFLCPMAMARKCWGSTKRLGCDRCDTLVAKEFREYRVSCVTASFCFDSACVWQAATLSNPVPFWKLVLSGAGSGFASTCVLTPVELIKCRLQAQIKSSGSENYKGPIDCIARTVQEEGVTGLWKGNLSTLAREVPGNMAWFGVYEAGMRSVQRARGDERKKDVPLYWSALSGSAAGVAYWAVPFPADTVKSKIQTDSRFQNASFSSVFKTIVKEEGLAGLYRGCAITCIRAIPSHALVFYFYEVADRFLLQFWLLTHRGCAWIYLGAPSNFCQLCAFGWLEALSVHCLRLIQAGV